MILVDSNVLLDVFTREPQWYSWSLKALSDASSTNRLVINPIIYSEVSIGFKSVQKLDLVLKEIGLLNEPLSPEVSLLAGKAFLWYKQKGGNKTSPLPVFFLGAHASNSNYKLLTKDRHRFLNYFPKLQIIRPSTWSTRNLSWENIYRKMATSDEDWSDWTLSLMMGWLWMNLSNNLFRFFENWLICNFMSFNL